MVTVFRRNWWLESAPTNADLEVRAFTECQITLNNSPVGVAPRPEGNWKKPTAYDVAGLLRAGTNEISVAVANSNGPPALWLSLRSGQWVLNSDQTWQSSLCGAVWQPARPASARMIFGKGNRLAGGERCLESFMKRLPILLLFAGLSFGILCLAQYLWRRSNALGSSSKAVLSKRHATMLIVLVGGLWIILFMHNRKLLPAFNGFDVNGHLGYIEYIRQRHALPLANEGWEMHQPPLYYLLCASILSVFHLATTSDDGIAALRLFGLVLGLIQIGLVFASLRVIFPNDAPKQVVGLILAAFMPVHLYQYQYVTNEILGATLATASLYCCLRILNSERPPVGLYGALGLCLGAALLTKITAMAVALVILAILIGHLLTQRERGFWIWIRTVGLTSLLCLAVSGWYYFRVWAHFGSIFVGIANNDRTSGFAWQADPGYGTAAYYGRFGWSLVSPLFSGLNGFADGLYSTLWGDGWCGGVAALSVRPPWNYDLMAAGYWLAVLPAVAIVAGLIAAGVSVIRRPQGVWLLLAGLGVTMGLALIYFPLKYPYYVGNTKAQYGLPAMMSLCAFGTWGMDILTRRWRRARVVLWIGLGTWAINSYASMWIQSGAPYTHIALTRMSVVREDLSTAVEGFQDILEVYPQNAGARLALAGTLEQMGRTKEALQQYEFAWRDHPHDPDCVAAMARALAQQGQTGEAIKLVQQLVQDAPDRPDIFPLLGRAFTQQKQLDRAVAAYEEALRVTPGDPDVHHDLGKLNLQLGRFGPAIDHLLLAVRLKPDYAEAHNDLGIALWRSGRIQEARESYEQALRHKPDYAGAHNNLGAILAQTGRLQEAIAHFEQALRIKPEDAEAHYNLGAALERSGQAGEAIAHYEQALRISPRMDKAQSRLTHLRTVP